MAHYAKRFVQMTRTGLLVLLSLAVTIVSAQASDCPDIVTQALESVDDFCATIGRNQACYGNFNLSAEPQPDAPAFTFDAVGDVTDVDNIFSLELTGLDEEAGTWGVAVLNLQADIPNTLPGQNVTFVLFGDVQIENASTDEQSPMQAFYLSTGIGDSACEEAPESGLLIQTPDGVEEVTFNINGVDVQVGSTVLFQTESITEDENELLVTTVEGSAALQFDDENYPVVAGTQARLPLNGQLLPVGRPDLPEAYDENRVRPLPVNGLPRRINVPPPLGGAAIGDLQERIRNGQPPCGVDGLPPCSEILPVLQNGENLPPRERFGQRFEPGVNCVLFAERDTNPDNLPICPPTERGNRPPPTRALANNALPFDGDADEDGVINSEDACPLRAGTVEFLGCTSQPVDTDGDGLVDALDFCPLISGGAEMNGCPNAPMDSDGDGVPDALDACRDEVGTRLNRGCPEGVEGRPPLAPAGEVVQDADSDGVPDAIDACRDEAGIRLNRGCPEGVEGRPPPDTNTVVDDDGVNVPVVDGTPLPPLPVGDNRPPLPPGRP
ncbi:MAG: thrombospondin type 3 repeat-containing protein [Chloroflexota bacterium]